MTAAALAPAPSREAELLAWLSERGWVTGYHLLRWGGSRWGADTGAVQVVRDRLLRQRQIVSVRTLRCRKGLEYRLADWVPTPAVADAASPWQRLCDAIADEPSRVWHPEQLERAAQCEWATARLCLERAVREGLLVPEGDGWRLADVRGGR